VNAFHAKVHHSQKEKIISAWQARKAYRVGVIGAKASGKILFAPFQEIRCGRPIVGQWSVIEARHFGEKIAVFIAPSNGGEETALPSGSALQLYHPLATFLHFDTSLDPQFLPQSLSGCEMCPF